MMSCTLRRIVQALFLLAFVALVLRTNSLFLPPEGSPAVPTHAFFLFDPLVWVTASLARGLIAGGVLFALGAAATAVLFGRVFCGWVCPLGTTLDLADRVLFSRKQARINVSLPVRTALWRLKYCLLVVLLIMAALGIQAAGWFDPISLATRTFALSFYTALDFWVKTLRNWGILPAAWYEYARDRLGMADLKSFFFIGQTLFFLIFAALAVLLFVQKRFWCRNVCPLGGLLGVLSSFRVLRIEIRHSSFPPACGGTVAQASSLQSSSQDTCDTGAGKMPALHGSREQEWQCSDVMATHKKDVHPTAGKPTSEKKAGTCIACGRCIAACKMGAIAAAAESQSTPGGTPAATTPAGVLNQECIHCQTCVSVCPTKAVKLRFGLPRPSPLPTLPGRRGFLASCLTAVAALPLFKRNPFLTRDKEGRLDAVVGRGPVLRPPGAHGVEGSSVRTDAEFLALCVRCGSCVKVCPSNALHPALLEAGPAGLWAPMFVPRIGYCVDSCFDCGRVCPTGALEPLDGDKKKRVRMGTAFVDKNRCIVWVEGAGCAKCEEVCPLPEKAIKMQEVELSSGRGMGKTVSAPLVDRDLCIGCGYCENACPVEGQAGIRVSPPQTTL